MQRAVRGFRLPHDIVRQFGDGAVRRPSLNSDLKQRTEVQPAALELNLDEGRSQALRPGIQAPYLNWFSSSCQEHFLL